MLILRSDDAGRSYSLVITKRGRDAVQIACGSEEQEAAPVDAESCTGETIGARRPPRDGSKITQVIRLISRETGASLPELISATGWLPHTTRAALTGLRKRGYAVIGERQKKGGPLYRITHVPGDAAAA